MLVLTRRLGETIVIDGCMKITVLALKGDRIRIGVTAPRDITVDRHEAPERRSEFRGSPQGFLVQS
jgi:carbon storage regulator